jgi:hypothetical protein
MIYCGLLEENVYKIKNTDSILVGFQSNQDNRQSSKKNNKAIIVYLRLYLLMTDLGTPETFTVWRNILKVNCESIDLSLHGYFETHVQQNKRIPANPPHFSS